MKKNMRRIALILVLVMTVAFSVSCGNGSDGGSAAGSADGSASEGTITYRMSMTTAVDDPVTLAANEFADKVAERTDGRVIVKVFPANQLGDYLAVFDEVMRGTIDMAYAPPTDNYEPDIYLSFLPYLITSYEDIPKVYGKDSVLFQETEKLYENLNLKFLGYGTIGFLGVGATKPVVDENHELITSSLIRTSSDLLSKLTMEGFGYNVSTMPYVDVFSGLQTGIIDGWLGGNPSINYFNFRDVIKYYYHFKVIMENAHLYMGQDAFNKMSEEDQAIFIECADEMLEQSYKDAQALDEEYMKELENFGIEVVEFTPEELDEMADLIRTNVWPAIANDKYSEEMIEKIKADLE